MLTRTTANVTTSLDALHATTRRAPRRWVPTRLAVRDEEGAGGRAVIVRVMGEGQWRVDDDVAQQLNGLDDRVGEAVNAGDEQALAALLREMAELVRSRGSKLEDADLSPSEAIVPPEDLTMDEAKELLTGEGLIPDFPSQS